MAFRTVDIMGVPVFSERFETAIDQAVDFLREDRLHMICTPNTEFIMRAQEDAAFLDLLNRSDLNIPDGFGLVLASRVNHLGLEEKIAGVEFMDRLLAHCASAGERVYFLGGAQESLERAIERILETYPTLQVAGSHHGFFDAADEPRILDGINRTQPAVLFVALGSPKQEWWIDRHREALGARLAIGVGGSLDIWSGQAKRAPAWMIAMGLEWLYRLFRQPSRIGRMMVIPRFMWRLLKQRLFNH